MKKILTYLIISASVFLLVSCDKPAPTQLIDDTNNDYEVELLKDDCIYLFTDGYQDQFGGIKKDKFMRVRFNELLLSIYYVTYLIIYESSCYFSLIVEL